MLASVTRLIKLTIINIAKLQDGNHCVNTIFMLSKDLIKLQQNAQKCIYLPSN